MTWDFCKSYYGINVDHNRTDGVLTLNLRGKIDKFFLDHPILAKLKGNSNVPVMTPAPVTSIANKYKGAVDDDGKPKGIFILRGFCLLVLGHPGLLALGLSLS